jgi:hypothetical protein
MAPRRGTNPAGLGEISYPPPSSNPDADERVEIDRAGTIPIAKPELSFSILKRFLNSTGVLRFM